MRLVKKNLGQYKSRGEVKDVKVIEFQGLAASAESLLDAAMVSLVASALDGNGPLASVLKKTAKEVLEKFSKQNPSYQFTKLGRTIGTKNKPDAEKPGPKSDTPKPSKKAVAVPKKVVKTTDKKSKPAAVAKKVAKDTKPVKKSKK